MAPSLLQYFEDPVSHADALAALHGVDTITVIELLEQLLVPNRLERLEMLQKHPKTFKNLNCQGFT